MDSNLPLHPHQIFNNTNNLSSSPEDGVSSSPQNRNYDRISRSQWPRVRGVGPLNNDNIRTPRLATLALIGRRRPRRLAADNIPDQTSIVPWRLDADNLPDQRSIVPWRSDADNLPDRRSISRRRLDADNLPDRRSIIRRRLDIDNMPYEQVLELQERIGIVKTGSSVENITNCLKTRTVNSGDEQICNGICIVCQDNYKDQDTIGTLKCEHEYHRDCIKEWLLLKNVCPICKQTALLTKG